MSGLVASPSFDASVSHLRCENLLFLDLMLAFFDVFELFHDLLYFHVSSFFGRL